MISSIRFARRAALSRISLLLTLVLCAGSANAATFYVNNQSAAATDAGAGTLAQPYRTISAAVNQRGGPGTIIEVLPGVYREQVSVSASGIAGNPFVIRASGPGVVIEGSESFATAAQWVPFSGNVWLASGVTWAAQQVIADGQRLQPSIVAPATMPSGSFTYVAGTGLYVNVGGGNPGGHGTLVGRYAYGFSVPQRSWVTIAGFEIRRSDTKGIFSSGLTTNCEFRGNTIWRARLSGIHLSGGSAYTIAGNTLFENGDHGVYVTGGVTGSTIRDNDSYRNARITARAANGFHVFASPGNRLERNRSHENEDAGFQVNAGSNDVVLIENRSWNNGDHGFDHLNSTGVWHIHNVSSGNLRDGFSFEGASQNARVYNCISVDNGITTNRADFFVDATSAVAFESDYNLFWNSTLTAPVRIGNVPYATVAAYAAATGKDSHSRQANPQFVNAAGGDFHLLATSPAIDAATSALPNWPALDADGHARFDVPTVANQGAGPVTFADLGAYEFSAPVIGNLPPIAALVVQPATGSAPLSVTANASTSRDPDGNIVSYTFDFGDGTTVGPQIGATAPHMYAAGTWTARVTVKDNGGLTNSTTARVVVSAPSGDRAPIVVAPPLVSISEAQTLTVNVTASDPDGDAIQSLTADLTRLPAGSNARFVANGTRTGGTLTWTPTYSDSGRYSVTFRASNALSGTATTAIRVLNVDRAPVVSSPSNYHVGPGSLIVFTVRAVDPDGDAIHSLTADLSRMPSNSLAKFVVVPTNIAGVFTWLIGPTVDGNFKAKFTATNALEGTSNTNFHVKAGTRGGGGKGGSLESEAAEVALPTVLALSNGSPNPAAGPIDFALDLPRAATVQWSVFDVQGRAVWSEERSIGAGTARLHWDGTSSRGERVAKGVYLARVRVEGTQFLRRIVRL